MAVINCYEVFQVQRLNRSITSKPEDTAHTKAHTQNCSPIPSHFRSHLHVTLCLCFLKHQKTQLCHFQWWGNADRSPEEEGLRDTLAVMGKQKNCGEVKAKGGDKQRGHVKIEGKIEMGKKEDQNNGGFVFLKWWQKARKDENERVIDQVNL